MARWKNFLFNCSFGLTALLIFLLVFEDRLIIPAWLQVAGRMHPMILHFPLVLIIIYASVNIFLPSGKQKETYKNAGDLILLLAAFTSAITALMGLFLTRESGYDADAIFWHKWSGISVPIFALLWYYFNKQIQQRRFTRIITSFASIFLILFAGHEGAGITHGEDFILAPIKTEKKPQVSIDEAEVFAHMVKPILQEKCMSCHNAQKAKGGLVMETEDFLLKGGKSGQLWDTSAADLGLMMQRVQLPLEAKKHMSPKGKPQLTDEEMEILTRWLRKGANFKLKVADLPASDTLHQLAVKVFSTAEIAEYEFEEADPSTIQKLNTVNRTVSPEALESPALFVNFFNSSLYKPEQLQELIPVKKQIVTLDLAKMPVKDEDLKLISQFENLRRLNLSFTAITGSTLQELIKLKHLNSLSISGTGVKAEQLKQLQYFKKLKTVYAWNTSTTAAALEQLQQQIKYIHFENGYRGDTTVLKLTPPVLKNDEGVISGAVLLKLRHYIQGASIRYTIDGSDPDSLHSAVYKGNETINSNAVIKAKAFKSGWISSDIIEFNFYKNTYTPDSVIYLTRPDKSYQDVQGKMLIDKEKGELNFTKGKWVAYHGAPMECLLQFPKPEPIQSITLSSLVDMNRNIMPAKSIEIWGGDNIHNLKLLGKLIPEQPTAYKAPFMKGYECKFNSPPVKYVKIISNPVAKSPAWLRGKGDKGWIFVDEVLVN